MKSFQNLNILIISYLGTTLENHPMFRGNCDTGIVISKNSLL